MVKPALKAMRRGDSALWILTKMAMLFFIVALAAILVSFGNIERSALCDVNAQKIAETISFSLNQVINSPLEDEGRVLKLDASLAVGEGRYSQYVITVSKLRSASVDVNDLIVEVKSVGDARCVGVKALPYPKRFDASSPKQLYFLSSFGSNPARYSYCGPGCSTPIIESIVFAPSTNVDFEKRSRYAAFLKCTSKKTSRTPYVFLQDCVETDPGQCINTEFSFTAGGSAAKDLCGFN